MYLPYCKSKPTSDAVRLEYEGYFRAQQLALKQKLSLEDLLIAPVQRFTKYQLLIRVGGTLSLSLCGCEGDM